MLPVSHGPIYLQYINTLYPSGENVQYRMIASSPSPSLPQFCTPLLPRLAVPFPYCVHIPYCVALSSIVI